MGTKRGEEDTGMSTYTGYMYLPIEQRTLTLPMLLKRFTRTHILLSAETNKIFTSMN